jgi:hypothetical protein
VYKRQRVGQASDALSAARDEKYGDSWYIVGQSLKDVADSFGKLFEKLNSENGQNGISAIQKITAALEAFANVIDRISGAYSKLREFRNLPGFKQLIDLELAPQKAITRVLTQPKNGSVPQGLRSGNGVTININGAVDANGTRRQLEQLLKTSARSMGQVNLVGNAL